MESMEFLDCENATVASGDPLKFKMNFRVDRKLEGVRMRITVKSRDDVPVGISVSDEVGSFDAETMASVTLAFDTSLLAQGTYYLNFAVCQYDDNGNPIILDNVARACSFTVINGKDDRSVWSQMWWGSIKFPPMKVCEAEAKNIN